MFCVKCARIPVDILFSSHPEPRFIRGRSLRAFIKDVHILKSKDKHFILMGGYDLKNKTGLKLSPKQNCKVL